MILYVCFKENSDDFFKVLDVFKDEKELVDYFAYDYTAKPHPFWGRSNRYNDFLSVQRLSKGDMLERVSVRGTGYVRSYAYRQYALLEVNIDNTYKVLDLRNYKKQIAKVAEAGGGVSCTEHTANAIKKKNEKYFLCRHGKTHKTSRNYRKTSGFRERYRDHIDNHKEDFEDVPVNVKMNKVGGKEDPWGDDVSRVENNWKSKKCRSQWQWHKKQNAGSHAKRSAKYDMREMVSEADIYADMLYEDMRKEIKQDGSMFDTAWYC